MKLIILLILLLLSVHFAPVNTITVSVRELNYKPLRSYTSIYIHANLDSMSIVIRSGGNQSMFALDNGLLRIRDKPSYSVSVDKVKSNQIVVIKPCTSATQWDMIDLNAKFYWNQHKCWNDVHPVFE